MGLSDELENIVLPEFKTKWPDLKQKWFSTHSGCKIPGLLKISIYWYPYVNIYHIFI